MVLGTVKEVEAEYERWRARKTPSRNWPQRRDASTVEDDKLWPNATIPYVIDPRFNENGLADIREAINEWNTKTVITLVERTTEDDFIKFRAEGGSCQTTAGKRGGEQGIWLQRPDGCGLTAAIHEIGHVVGLWHEHQREDRDAYLFVTDAQLYGGFASQYSATHPADGPYDYASVMSYDRVETIPPGMYVKSDRLSPGDIAGVARLYGTPPATTTISTNPPGLEINVDGESVVTPATFNWMPGSEHVLEASSPQIVGGTRLLFGRWSDGGLARHEITANAENPWIEATYIVQRALRACADPAEAGVASILPDSPDGYYTIRSPVEIEAATSSGRTDGFMAWSILNRLFARREGGGGSFVPGRSANPVAVSIRENTSERTEYKALWEASPLFRIDSNVDGIRILANGSSRTLPWAVPARQYRDGISVAIPEETVSGGHRVRYRFGAWSDGGASSHDVRIPAAGGSIGAEFSTEYGVRIGVRNRGDKEDAIKFSPPSDDGFYAPGTQVQVTAVPSPTEHFAGWFGDAPGHDPVQTLVMDGPKALEAVFSKSEPLRAGEDRDLVLSAGNQYRVYNFSAGWNVLVPPDASELTVRFQSSSAANVDLYVRQRKEVWSVSSGSGSKPQIDANFESTTPGASESITISRGSTPRLTHDVYFIALGVPPTPSPIRGTLSVAIRRSGIVKAWPGALTFVSTGAAEVAPQTVRLTHATATGSPMRFRVESSRPWISATPSEWVQTGSGLTEVSLAVNGAGLLPGTHWGEVTIAQVQEPDAATGGTPSGIEIPMAFAVLSDTGDVSRSVNGARIRSTPENGDTYGVGDIIEVGVNFVSPVHITGKPTLTLGIGNRTRQVEWDSVPRPSPCEGGNLSMGFRYQVQAEDQDADGISVPKNALALNGGKIQTIHGTPAILPLAPIADHPGHKVNGGVVTAPEVSGVRIRSRPRDSLSYGMGEGIEAQVIFSRGVEVTGSPTLAFGIGAETQQALLASKSDRVLVFRYAVQAGDADTDGISIPADALALNGGSIRGSGAADARLDLGSHAIANDPEHRVDGSKVVAPEVSSVRITSRPQDGMAYAAREKIEARVEFDSEVEVTGSPTLALSLGTATRMASLDQHDDRTLHFSYTVQAGDIDADGISISAGALALNGGSVRDASGVNAVLDLGSQVIANDPEHKVDGSKVAAPVVDRVRIAERPQDGVSYGAGEPITAFVWFSQEVEVTGSPTLALSVGSATRLAALSSSNGQYVWFRYTVQAGDTDTDGISILAGALALNGGSIRNHAGADAALDFGSHAIINDPGHRVDGSKVAPPAVGRVRISGRPQDGVSYGAGERISAYVRFSQEVEVTGSPTLALSVGSATRLAALSSSNGQFVWFRYTVQAGDTDTDGIGILAGALALNGGSIRNDAGVDANLDFGSHAITNDPGHKVDGSKVAAPVVGGVRISSRPRDGISYGAGERISAYVRFSQEVEVTGSPTLALSVGSATRLAALSSSNGQFVWFRYTVQAGDTDADGVSILADALALNGGSIRSVAGPDAALGLGSHAIVDDPKHKVGGG